MNLFDLLRLRQQSSSPQPAASPSPRTGDSAQAVGSPVPLPIQAVTATGAPSSPVAFQAGQPVGFFTDSTLCIGCKACEVACKQWNQLPANEGGANVLTGDSYDNTGRLDGINWRHVKFIEQFTPDREQGRWLMLSDVCKHCVQAGCLEVCPTGAITRTEFDTVVIQSNVCNGCRDCIAACPFGVIEINPVNNTAQKCTLCYDRLQSGLTPACAQACPTASIQFGPIQELRSRADARVAALQAQNVPAYIYGDENMLGGLNAFSLLIDKPEVYGLPVNPKMPSRNLWPTSLFSIGGAAVVGLLGLLAFRKNRMDRAPEDAADAPRD
jgi:formate dehydrogenase iron-sulfur subunit